MALKFYTSVAEVLKVKVRKFLGLISRFVEVTGEKLVAGGLFCLPLILNMVKKHYLKNFHDFIYQLSE